MTTTRGKRSRASGSRGRWSRASGSRHRNQNRRSSTPIMDNTNEDYDEQTRTMVHMMLARGLDVPEEFARYIPRNSAPSNANNESGHTHSNDHNTEVDHQLDATQPVAVSTQFLQLLPDSSTFANNNNVARTITRVYRDFQECSDYRWTHLAPYEQEMIFDGLLNTYPVAPGTHKEIYRPAFKKMAEKRISSTTYIARKNALKKTGIIDRDDYDLAKAFPPIWSTPERWVRLCDLFKNDPQFIKRSKAGKLNRTKQKIISTGGSKSFGTLRHEMTLANKVEPSLPTWWEKTHTRNGEWTTPEAKLVNDRYIELYLEKHGSAIPTGGLPKFDRDIWNVVLAERDVGPNRKQVLGGLPVRGCTMDNSPCSTGRSCYAGSSYVIPQPSQLKISEEMVSQLTQSLVAAMTPAMTSVMASAMQSAMASVMSTSFDLKIDHLEKQYQKISQRGDMGEDGDNSDAEDDDNSGDDDEEETPPPPPPPPPAPTTTTKRKMKHATRFRK